MTIHLGNISIEYDGDALAGPQAQQLFGLLRAGLDHYRARRNKISTLGLLVRRWLVAPVLARQATTAPVGP